MKGHLKYRLVNLLIPCALPIVLSFLLTAKNRAESFEQLYKLFYDTAFWLFCGLLPFIAGGVPGLDEYSEVALSVTLRLLTIVPFVAYLPKQDFVAKGFLIGNIGVSIIIAAVGFLWLVLSGT